ncbi:MAG: hypothetical protein J6A85_01635 [Clostridia bacterium]|nr:hypothetical protein [Clostridia bacterium]
MKKVLAFLLVAVMLVALCACNSDETSKTPAGDDSSVAGESTPVDESEPADEDSTPADEDSSTEEPEVSEEVSEEPIVDPSTGETVEIPEFTNKFVSFGTASTSDHANDGTSFSLTGYNTDLAYGAVVLYDARYGAATPAGLEDYAVLVATYQAKPLFGYVKTAYYAVGEASAAVNIPADGFVVCAHKYQEAVIKVMAAYTDSEDIFPHGIQVKAINWDATYASTAPVQDGKISANEYAAAVDHAEIDNDIWDYSQFAKTENYDIVGDLYLSYDAEYLYFAVVVGMDYHYAPDTTGLWNECSIQVNISTKAPTSDYISQYYDHGSGTGMNMQAQNDGVIGQYGYAVTNDGVAVSEAFMGATKPAEDTFMVVRDEANQQTIYEAKISWEELGFEAAPTVGTQIGFSYSINARPDSGADSWINLRMRNGGGIIGRNDLSKMATVTIK